jgi:hypothetical protein
MFRLLCKQIARQIKKLRRNFGDIFTKVRIFFKNFGHQCKTLPFYFKEKYVPIFTLKIQGGKDLRYFELLT